MFSYKHCNGDKAFKRGTIAFVLPNKDDLKQLLVNHGTHLRIHIGGVRLSKKEKFVKKLGREYAEKAVSVCDVHFVGLEPRGTKHVYHFVATVPNFCPNEHTTQRIEFAVSTTMESPHVNLLYAFFQE